jgi:pyruvate dehydrogenase E2 component (dihydrolipoamide acetyltransferase)
MADVVMPRLSDSMEEGTIVRWLKDDGDEVRRGEEIAEIETDKATMSYEADQDGVLSIVAAEGDTLAIGEVIARIGGQGEEAASEQPGKSQGSAEDDSSPEAASGAEAEAGAEAESKPAESQSEATEPEPRPPAQGNGGERVKASPVARRVARDLGVELSALSGSGPGGRIVKADVETAAQHGGPGRDGAQRDGVAATGRGEAQVQELARTQSLIARRMAESKATVPDFALQTEIDMEAAVEARSQLKAVAGDRAVPSLNDMVVKACALALREFPRANASYRDGRFELHERVNVGVAVATEDALVVPTVFDADHHSLGDIATTTRELATKVREGRVTPPELSGGTFTVSNLGMYGVSSFTAVINPPQAAILAVGSVEPRAVVRDGQIVARHTMAATLVCDHRILYGAPAAEFLARVRELLENPGALSL